VPKPELPTGDLGSPDASAAVVDQHEVVFDGGRVATKIYDRSRLEPGALLSGPAIVTEFDSTTVVLPGYRAEVDANFNILITPDD
jgi:N-methylhydantoinase A